MLSINCQGKLIDFEEARIMGILNITPDSFFNGSRINQEKDWLATTEKMLNDGATFIDVGGYSSRPGAAHVSEEEELARILPVVDSLKKHFKELNLSIDTFRSKVAQQCLDKGAAIINDISAGNLDPNMFKTISLFKVPYIMMHMQGTPQTMQNNPQYNNVTVDIVTALAQKEALLRQMGVADVIVDPGFGFGKSLTDNYQILRELSHFKSLDCPLLVGLSRKSMLYKPLAIEAESALNATTAAHVLALMNGADILRVHDVKEASEALKITQLYLDKK